MATIGLWALALVLGVFVWRRHGRAGLVDAVKSALLRGLHIVPRVAMVLIVAGFAVRLMPSGLVGGLIGPESGFSGVLIAMLVGGLIPAGASVSFSLVVLLSEAGAGWAQLVTLITAWSVFAIHRVIVYEVPLMGLRFSMLRLAASLPLPLIAAGIAALVLTLAPSV